MGTYRPNFSQTDKRLLGDTDFRIREKMKGRHTLKLEQEINKLKSEGRSKYDFFKFIVILLEFLIFYR